MTGTKKTVWLVVLALALTACQSAMSRDVDLPNEAFTSSVELDPEQLFIGEADHYSIFYNMDGHPNIVRVCIDGVAILTTTREYGDAVNLVPEWNDECEAYEEGDQE